MEGTVFRTEMNLWFARNNLEQYELREYFCLIFEWGSFKIRALNNHFHSTISDND